jgi:bifunctional ADP-heptose synthase (sugar kinase/adenylyltransferase)
MSTPIPHHLLAVASELGAALAGLVVSHRGRTMTLTGRPGQWEAVALAEPADVEEHDVYGYGDTVPAALNACADEAELVEAGDNDGSEEDE